MLRQSSTQLLSAGEGSSQQVAHLTDSRPNSVERFGGYLERASGEELLRDAEDFARRRPWMVAGIGLVAGLAASRFLKASSERRYGSVAARRLGGQILLLDAGPPAARISPPPRGGVVTGR